jgi:hypothetical protein
MDGINAVGNPNHVLGILNDHLLVIRNVVVASPTTIDQESEAYVYLGMQPKPLVESD